MPCRQSGELYCWSYNGVYITLRQKRLHFLVASQTSKIEQDRIVFSSLALDPNVIGASQTLQRRPLSQKPSGNVTSTVGDGVVEGVVSALVFPCKVDAFRVEVPAMIILL